MASESSPSPLQPPRQGGAGEGGIIAPPPSSLYNDADNNADPEPASAVYRCCVVDSGPVIRLGMASLWQRAQTFYTVPAVLREIRDAKARRHLDNLPVELIVRDPTHEAVQAVVAFAKQTGDYQSLSSVDLQVLGLLYDLEREGCLPDASHIRTTPKRMLGLGKLETLGGAGRSSSGSDVIEAGETGDDDAESDIVGEFSDDDNDGDDESSGEEYADDEEKEGEGPDQLPQNAAAPQGPSSWAKIVNPTATGRPDLPLPPPQEEGADFTRPFGMMNLRGEQGLGGQFSDAEEDDDDDDDQEGGRSSEGEDGKVEEELELDFPSLAASLAVPYEGDDSDDEDEQQQGEDDDDAAAAAEDLLAVAEKLRLLQEETEEARKRDAVRPISNSGKLYNSFRKYGDLMKPKAPPAKKKDAPPAPTTTTTTRSAPDDSIAPGSENQSRIIGGSMLAGQGADVEDDGEGWITCPSDIRKMKAAGALDPKRDPAQVDADGPLANRPNGPPISQRTACATTDFAMQNVILQMGLELLSVDGMKVRKLKSWVTRCGACFKVYTSAESDNTPLGSKRLFCGHCGSDMMQRIAASVDGKTGRLRLHLSKRYRHNLRGTKFSLPKPGTGNRFQGDLLLREDQLLVGAWNQKAKMRSGGKAKSAAQSMFGKDIATNVGCHTRALVDDDIRVGFGRRNPNAAKGRERRGKKKKSADRACGLRRY